MNPIVLAPTSLSNSPPLEFIDAAVSAGYDGIGLRLFRSPGISYPFYPVAGDAKLEREVKKRLQDSNLKVYDILSFYLQPETDLQSMAPALSCGADIGATYALVIGDDPEWDRMVDNFGDFCQLAWGYGLTASIEAPVTQRQVNRLGKAIQLIKDAGHPNAVVCIDPYHFHNVGDTADMIRAADPGLFPYTQIDDGTGGAPAGRCAPGEGVVPLADILDALPANLPLSLEWGPPRDAGYSAAEWAKIALDKTRAFLDGYYAAKK